MTEFNKKYIEKNLLNFKDNRIGLNILKIYRKNLNDIDVICLTINFFLFKQKFKFCMKLVNTIKVDHIHFNTRRFIIEYQNIIYQMNIFNFKINNSNFIFYHKLRNSTFRSESNSTLVDKFLTLLKKNLSSIDLILEVGAHEASFSKLVRNISASIEIFAFEGSKNNYDRFNHQIKFSELNINYLNIAISNENTLFKFYENINNSGSNSLNKSLVNNTNFSNFYTPSLRLNNILNNIDFKKNICIWIDVEGSEFEVLKSLDNYLNSVALIFIEVSDLELFENQKLSYDIIKYLTNHNFKILMRDFNYPGQYNIIFVNNSIVS